MNRGSVLLAAIAGAVAVLVPNGLVAQQNDETEPTYHPFEYADALIEAQQPELACGFLELVYGLDTEVVGALSRLATCTLAMGDPQSGMELMSRALALEPDNEILQQQVVALELAVELAELDQAMLELEAGRAALAAARQEARRAEAARDEMLLAPVIVEEPELPGPLASGGLSVSRVYDSNVNGGTYNDRVVGFGLPLIIDPDSKETGGWATRLNADGSVVIPLDWDNALQLDAGLGATVQDQLHQHSMLNVSGSASWIFGTNVTGGQVRAHAELEWVGGLFEQFAAGLGARGHHEIAPATTLVGGIDATHKMTAKLADRGWAVGGHVGLRHDFAQGLSAGVNLSAERVGVHSPVRSYWKIGADTYVSAVLTDRLGLNLNGGIDIVNFDSGLAMFPDDRKDMRYRLGARLNLAVPELAEGASLYLTYDFSHQQSNHDLFDNNRHVVAVGMHYAF